MGNSSFPRFTLGICEPIRCSKESNRCGQARQKAPYRQPTLMARHENFFPGTKPVVLQQWSLQPTQRELGDDNKISTRHDDDTQVLHGAGICTATFALKNLKITQFCR